MSKLGLVGISTLLSFVLAACGGGGGGETAPAAAGSAGAGSAAGVVATTAAPGSTTSALAAGMLPASDQPAAAHYSLGSSSAVNQVDSNFNEELVGMARTPENGYRAVWYTTEIVNSSPVRTYFEQRYDGDGHPVGTKTVIGTPSENMTADAPIRVDAVDGGYLQITTQFTHPEWVGRSPVALVAQHYAADGTAIDGPITIASIDDGFRAAAMFLPGGAIAVVWEGITDVHTLPLNTAMLMPQ